MKKAGVGFESFCDKVVKGIALLFLAVFTCWTAMYTYEYPRDYSAEYLLWNEDKAGVNVLVMVGVLLITGVLSWLLFRGKEEAEQKKTVHWFAIAETALAGILLTIWVSVTQMEQSRDAVQVYSIAMRFLEGDYSDMLYN